ncbi:MAG TPA: hypothetical protein VGS28_00965 [Candidatus Saccharimonadales bacterium]|nr:hypothetical protein [Candidatus Saccharimonadales bacterium]
MAATKRKVSSKRKTAAKPSIRQKLLSHTVLLPVTFIVMFGLTGVYALTSSSAARFNYHYFYACGGIYAGPSTKSIPYGELCQGWHAVLGQYWCPNRPDSEVHDGKYYNDWWIQLAYHSKGYINDVYASGGNNNSPVPGVEAWYSCPTTLM